jgi:hypothetical protein
MVARHAGAVQHSVQARNPTRIASLSGMARQYMYGFEPLLFIDVEIDRAD